MLLLASVVAALGIVLAWFLARRATAPIRRLTATAARISRTGEIAMLPRVGGSREVTALSASLRGLLRRVGSAEHALSEWEERSSHDALAFQQRIEALKRIADADPLTGLMNRRAFLAYAGEARRQARHERGGIFVLVADIDHFKRVNDTYGHGAGDLVICRIAALLAKAVRASDGVARFGGEEFVILLRDIDSTGVTALCERLLAEIRGSTIMADEHAIAVTISLGAAAFDDDDIQAVIERADGALYDAKRRGRDCLRFAGEHRVASAA